MTWCKIRTLRYQIKRTIFSDSKVWPVTCTYNSECNFEIIKQFEKHWSPILANERPSPITPTRSDKPLKYVLSMFPYPSGNLHLGHVKIYTSADVAARYFQMRGYDIVNPMGWDSFGLPAENAALDRGVDPNTWTYNNIKQMKNQLESLSLTTVSWREATSDPSFYKWTQWLLVQLMKHHLLYRARAQVNWDPVDKTVLADDQVDNEGKSWRSGAVVEKRFLTQWFIKTSAFVKDAYEGRDLPDTENGIDLYRVLAAQRNWIGKSPNGRVFYLPLDEKGSSTTNVLPVFTLLPETFLHDDAYILVSPDHWISTTDVRKIVNPFTGREIDIRIAENVNNIPNKFKATVESSSPKKQDQILEGKIFEKCLQNEALGGYLASSSFTDWLISRQRYWGTPIPVIHCPSCGPVSVPDEHLPVELPPVSDLRSWQESRTTSSSLSDKVTSKLAEIAPPEWLKTSCPKCGNKESVRETDTSDTFVDSSWYFFRFATEGKNDSPFDVDFWNRHRVSLYLGGPEHMTGHLLTSRMMYMFLRRYGYFGNASSEPYEQFLLQGIVTAKCFKDAKTGRYLTEEEASKMDKDQVITNWEKMSKSKGNGVDPVELTTNFGCDVTRYSVLGYGSSQHIRRWKGTEEEMRESTKFLRKLLLTMDEFFYIRDLVKENPRSPVIRRFPSVSITKMKDETLESVIDKLRKRRNTTVLAVTFYYGNRYRFGRGSKRLQDFLDLMRRFSRIFEVSLHPEYERCLGDFIIMLHPIMPLVTNEMWTAFTSTVSSETAKLYQIDKRIHEQAWPVVDDDYPIPIRVRIEETDDIFDIPVDRRVINEGYKGEIIEIVLDYLKNVLGDDEYKTIARENISRIHTYPRLKAVVMIKTGKEKLTEKRRKKGKAKQKSDEEDDDFEED